MIFLVINLKKIEKRIFLVMNNIIAIEGTDGSGKQTQIDKLFEFFKSKNFDVQKLSFPNYSSPSSGPVKMYLNGELSSSASGITAYQASILYAVDRFCTMKKYENFIQHGVFLLLDRYAGSNLIHQACKIDNENEKENYIKWICELEFEILKIPRPNLVVFLDMPPEFSIALAHNRQNLKCGEKKDIHEFDENHLKKAYENSLSIAKNQNWHIIQCIKNQKIESVEQIHQKIISLLKTLFNNLR